MYYVFYFEVDYKNLSPDTLPEHMTVIGPFELWEEALKFGDGYKSGVWYVDKILSPTEASN